MTHKHIISIFVLMSIVLPVTSFADVLIAKNTNTKDTPSVSISEKEKDKNRKQRISFALNAVDQNILIVEKSIKQATLRLEGVDQKSPKIENIKNNLTAAGEKLNEARKIISDIKANLKNTDTANAEQIKEIRARIEDAKKDIFESIKLAKKAIQDLKTMKIVKDMEPKVITTTKAN